MPAREKLFSMGERKPLPEEGHEVYMASRLGAEWVLMLKNLNAVRDMLDPESGTGPAI